MTDDADAGISAGPVLDRAVSLLEQHAQEQTDGVWLEVLTADVAPHIRDWNISRCWRWSEWPDRDDMMPEGTPSADVGIDLVARRRDDGKWVAIQAKARKLDERGEGNPVPSGEMNKFLAASSYRDVWAERWLVVNGDVSLSGYSPDKAAMSGERVKVVNVAQAVDRQRTALAAAAESAPCPHCGPTGGMPADRGGGGEGDFRSRRALVCSGKLSTGQWSG